MDSRLSLCLSLPSAGIRVVNDPRVVFVSSDLLLDCLAVPGAENPSRRCLGDYCSRKEDERRKGVHRGQRQRHTQARDAILFVPRIRCHFSYPVLRHGIYNHRNWFGSRGNEIKRSEGWQRKLSHEKFQPHVARPWCCGRGSLERSEGSTHLISESLSF